jgi:hypothetical protein
VTSSDDATLRFIAASFKSVWALELLLSLKRVGGACTSRDLVNRLRASELVVSRALESLVAAGLISNEEDTAVYLPASRSIAASVERAEELYHLKPDAVRRAIVNARASGITAFADAFRLRKESDD